MGRLQKGERKYKYLREDVIRKEELDMILDALGRIEYRGLKGEAWQCLTAILWLFGKRISEVIRLKTADIRIDENNMLSIRFLVLKKKTRKDPGVLGIFTKHITLENPYTNFIMYYLSALAGKAWNDIEWEEEDFDSMEAALRDYLNPEVDFLFPREQTKMGHIYRDYAWHVLKMIKPDISSHLFRHSLATQMAEGGASAYEMVNWFDWDRTDTALEYIRRSGRLTEKLSRREW